MRKLRTNIQLEQPFTKEDWQFLQDSYTEPIAQIILSAGDTAGNAVRLTGCVVSMNFSPGDESGFVTAGFVAINGEVIQVPPVTFPPGTFTVGKTCLLNIVDATVAPSPRIFPDASSQIMHVNSSATVVAATPASFPAYPILINMPRFNDLLVRSVASGWVVTGALGAPVFLTNASTPDPSLNLNTLRTRLNTSKELIVDGSCIYDLPTATAGDYNIMQIFSAHRPLQGKSYKFSVLVERTSGTYYVTRASVSSIGEVVISLPAVAGVHIIHFMSVRIHLD